MIQVTFHFNAPDKMAYTCRLLRKAIASGAKVVVAGEQEELDRLDSELWTFAAREFVPHCRGDAPAAMVASSPIVLAGADQPMPQAPVLVHLGGPVPLAMGQFEKIIEVVGQGEQDRLDARQRWKQYVAQGHDPAGHDVAQRGRVND